jgi:glycosyltransferase involved in cell wall biosynthesis
MRILIITPLFPPAIGGASSYFQELVPRLAKREDIDQLVILTERMPGEPRASTNGKMTVLRYLPTRVSIPRKKWIGHAVTYLMTQLWFLLSLSHFVQRNGIDLVHFHTRYRGPVFYKCIAGLDVPVVADLRDHMSNPYSLSAVSSIILTNSLSVQAAVRDALVDEHRTAMIARIFDPPAKPSYLEIQQILDYYEITQVPYVLYVGDMTANKGVYDLMDAIDMMDSAPVLLLVGTNREGSRFEMHAAQSAHARYLGQIPHEQVLALMSGAKAVLLPSRSEALGAVLLEALTMGTRVVCPPNVPEFAAAMPDCVLPEVSPEAIVKTLEHVLASDVPAYPFANHDPERVIDALMAIYRQLLHDSQSSDTSGGMAQEMLDAPRHG